MPKLTYAEIELIGAFGDYVGRYHLDVDFDGHRWVFNETNKVFKNTEVIEALRYARKMVAQEQASWAEGA